MFRWYSFDNWWSLLNVHPYRQDIEDTQSDQAGPVASRSDVVNNAVEDELETNESMDGEEIETWSDIDQIHVPAQFIRSNALGKRSIDGPSANHNRR